MSDAATLPSDRALQVRMSDIASFTTLQMEAALCAWEWMLENTNHEVFANDGEPLFEEVGYAGMRHCSMQAGLIVLQVFDHMEAQGFGFIGAYDWEFVPAVLPRLDWCKLCSDNQYHREPYFPDVAAIFASMFAADKAARGPNERLFSRKAAA